MTASTLNDSTLAVTGVGSGGSTSITTTNFDKTVVALVQKRLEELLRFPLVHLLPGNFRPATFVKGTNNTMRFLAIGDLTGSSDTTLDSPSIGTAPWLYEGVAPDTATLSIGYEEMNAWQAGKLIKLTDIALQESPFDLINIAAERVARDAIKTADRYVSRVLLAGTHRMCANGRAAMTNLTAGDLLAGSDIKHAVAILRGSSVPTFPDGTYHAIIHPYVAADLQADTDVGGWIDASRYAGAEQLMTGELGRYAGVRFVDSAGAGIIKAGQTVGSETPNGDLDVFSTFLFGPEAYAFGDWGQVTTHLTPPGGHSDPLYQSALVGWKGMFGAMLLGGTNAQGATGIKPRYINICSITGVPVGDLSGDVDVSATI